MPGDLWNKNSTKGRAKSIATKRKTTTSSEVKNRWNAAHYTRLTIVLDKDDAAKYKEKCTRLGLNFSDIPKEAIENFLRDN